MKRDKYYFCDLLYFAGMILMWFVVWYMTDWLQCYY